MLYHKSFFTKIASAFAHWSGHPIAFLLAFAVVVTWLVSGPFFNFSDTWQLIINTGTTIATFLMVFLVQNTQNRDSYAVQLKLDELIRAVKGAHNSLLDIEDLSEDELALVKKRYEELARKARHELKRGKQDTGIPRVRREQTQQKRAS